MPASSDENKRTNIRLSPEEKTIIVKAAKLQRKGYTVFMRESSCAAAAEVLASQTVFKLPADKWQAFCEILDRPPQDNPAIKKLLTEPSLFDK
jgi:uncharacterized protein (DUF1778 family)